MPRKVKGVQPYSREEIRELKQQMVLYKVCQIEICTKLGLGESVVSRFFTQAQPKRDESRARAIFDTGLELVNAAKANLEALKQANR